MPYQIGEIKWGNYTEEIYNPLDLGVGNGYRDHLDLYDPMCPLDGNALRPGPQFHKRFQL
ncbi:MAG: hypothetical protein JSV63_02975 [Candidatus Aenigmatarchaeota archaeon]|nr:MAG: hypothetical protein JSV63_02975 [Candidatus Aenigmarchaeota archaeon]